MNNNGNFPQQPPRQAPLNQFTQSRPLNTKVDNPELEYIQKMQRNSILWHLLSILIVFIASTVIHTYGILVIFGAVGIWITTAIAVYLMPEEERQNIRKARVWVIGYTSIAIIFDMIVSSLSLNVTGYGLDAASLQFLNILRMSIFLGTPVMSIGITVKRLHFNWDVRNNKDRISSYMRQDTKKLF